MDKINKWFNCNHYGPSPHQIMRDVALTFMKDVKDRNMEMCVSKEHLYSILCEGICVLYDQNLNNEYGHLTISNTSYFEQPPGWNQEIESIWIDFLTSRIFDEDYWERFWDYFGALEWESEVFNWRSEFQTMLPYYVTRSIHTLIAAGIIDEKDDDSVSSVSATESELD